MSEQPIEPDVFFLPWSVPDQASFAPLDVGVLARRLPHFTHLLLNEGDRAPTGLLEVQSPPDEGPPRWITLEEPIDPGEAMQLLPPGEPVRALVTGVLRRTDDALAMELQIHDGSTASQPIQQELDLDQPMRGMQRLVLGLAEQLGLPRFWPREDLLTANGDAFFAFLAGLDGAALLNSDLANAHDLDAELILAPFRDALLDDPGFGLALRTAHMSVATALEAGRLDEAGCARCLDGYFVARPTDGDGCVAIAEHLAVLGDDERAERWLDHAVRLESPPARALESLGILLANRGETTQAREFWLRGLELDGHPDFLAHLARMAFAEDQAEDAWERVLRGLVRIRERASRPGEWEQDGRGAGLLLRYLVEHLDDETPPGELAELLLDLCGGALDVAADRVELGRCLLALGYRDEARVELRAGIRADNAEARDAAARGLLSAEFPDFEQRFASAVDAATNADDPTAARDTLAEFVDRDVEFWPACFFLGVAERRLGNLERALDLMAEVLTLRPGQPDTLGEMADLFARRGNPKRALECIEQARVSEPDEPQLLAAQARYLDALGRRDEAREAIDRAIAIAPGQVELVRLRGQLSK